MLPEPPVQTEFGAPSADKLLVRKLSRWLIEASLVIVLMSQESDPASKADPRPGEGRASSVSQGARLQCPPSPPLLGWIPSPIR
jgi:hypothetical protein